MDSDHSIYRQNPAMLTPIEQRPDFQGFPMGFSSFCNGSSSNPFSAFSAPFYDPFRALAESNKFQQNQFSTVQFAENGEDQANLHVFQNRGFPDLNFKASFNTTTTGDLCQIGKPSLMDTNSCLICNNGVEMRTHSNNRTEKAKQIKYRRRVEKKSEIVKGQWTPDEDRVLTQLVEKHGDKQWSVIANNLPQRLGKQCRERWNNHLKPNIKKDRWSEEEDHILIQAHKQLGNRWSEITRRLPGRSENNIKNHWNATKRRISSHKGRIRSYNTALQNYVKSVMSSQDYISSSSTSIPSNVAANTMVGSMQRE